MKFNQRIGGTFDRTSMAEGTQAAAHQRRLARAEVAVEVDDGGSTGRASAQSCGQGGAQRQRGGFIR